MGAAVGTMLQLDTGIRGGGACPSATPIGADAADGVQEKRA